MDFLLSVQLHFTINLLYSVVEKLYILLSLDLIFRKEPLMIFLMSYAFP